MIGLAFGIYLVATKSLYRIVALYFFFNLIIFWITKENDRSSSSGQFWNSNQVFASCMACVVGLLGFLVVTCYQSLYLRPEFVAPMVGVIIVVGSVASFLNDTESFRRRTKFLLPVMIALVLFVNFSVYLAQPTLFAGPISASVDTYRDYTNAIRIIMLSHIQPNALILEQYYAPFPIVPLQISLLSLFTGLPANVAELGMGVVIEATVIIALWAFSATVIATINSRESRGLVQSASFVAILLVWLQPFLSEPDFLLEPLRFSILPVTLVLFLSYRTLTRSGSSGRSLLLVIFLILLVVVPMHAASGILLIIMLVSMGLINHYRPWVTIGVISLVFFMVYVVSSGPLSAVAIVATRSYLLLVNLFQGGPSILTQAAIGSARAGINPTEIDLWTEALPLALILSICTIFVIRLRSRSVMRDPGLRRVHMVYGIIAFAALAGGYMISWSSVDIRYFVYSATAAIAIAGTIVLALVLRSHRRLGGLILVGIIVLFAFSVAGSAVVLEERSPLLARMIPTQSESSAGYFVTAHLTGISNTQVVADWPYDAYVRALIYSQKIGIEQNVNTPELLFQPVDISQRSIVFERAYFLGSPYLKTISPNVKVLENVQYLNGPCFNKIFDSGSTFVYVNMP